MGRKLGEKFGERFGEKLEEKKFVKESRPYKKWSLGIN